MKIGEINPLPKPEGLNPFGGLNPNGLYVPMSEDEQESIQRLIESDDLEVVAHGWGVATSPKIIAGDHRVGIQLRLDFFGSVIKRPLSQLDLELRTGAGQTIYREMMPINPPLIIDGQSFIDFQWDIAIHSVEPKLVKQLVPGAKGLTSRRQDRDTKEMTDEGNMTLSATQKKLLRLL